MWNVRSHRKQDQMLPQNLVDRVLLLTHLPTCSLIHWEVKESEHGAFFWNILMWPRHTKDFWPYCSCCLPDYRIYQDYQNLKLYTFHILFHNSLTGDGRLHLEHALLLAQDAGTLVNDAQGNFFLYTALLHQVALQQLRVGFAAHKQFLHAEPLVRRKGHACSGAERINTAW